MRITPIPCLRDNYAYLLSFPGRPEVAVVDASEAVPVVAALDGRPLAAVLCTHHHADHVGGNLELAERFPGVSIYGYAGELGGEKRVPGQTHGIADGEWFELFGQRVQVMFIPGHTRTAIAFYFPDAGPDAGAVFTGDTLFGAGCGRLFEGTPAQMHASLARLMGLPADTRVYCGHEYTAANLRFALAVEPQSQAIPARQARVTALRERDEPSVPSTLADEAATNPFVRWAAKSVRAAVAGRDPVIGTELTDTEVFARVRKWKDSF